MATISRQKTWAAAEILTASDLNAEYNNIINTWNNHNSGSSTWTTLQASGATTVPLIVNNSTGTQNIANFQDNGTNIFTIADSSVFTFTGAQSLTDVRIDNTATDGDPILAFQLGGTSQFTMGVDDGDSDRFKIGTTAIGTNTRFTIDENGHIYIPATNRLYLDNGDDTYIFEESGNIASIVANDITIASFAVQQVRIVAGSAATPALSFFGDLDTGIYSQTGNIMGLVAGGNLIAEVAVSQLRLVDGSAATPAYVFSNDGDTGIWRQGANIGALAAGGVESIRWDNSTTANDTRLIVFDVTANAVVRVSRGATDSGGSGFRVLRIPN